MKDKVKRNSAIISQLFSLQSPIFSLLELTAIDHHRK